jgi:hypothetical protein
MSVWRVGVFAAKQGGCSTQWSAHTGMLRTCCVGTTKTCGSKDTHIAWHEGADAIVPFLLQIRVARCCKHAVTSPDGAAQPHQLHSLVFLSALLVDIRSMQAIPTFGSSRARPNLHRVLGLMDARALRTLHPDIACALIKCPVPCLVWYYE